MDLKSFQAHFSQFLYTRRPEENSIKWISDTFSANGKIEAGLRVYRNNLLVTLVDALGDTFPCVKHFLGDIFFNIAKDFIYSIPSKNSDLNFYSSDFSIFLSNSSYQHKEFLANLAVLEWSWEQSLYTKDDDILPKEEFLKMIKEKGDDVQIKLRDAAVIFQDNYGVFPHWKIFHGNQNPETLNATNISSRKFYLIWTDNRTRKIQEIEISFLPLVLALKEKKSIVEISNYKEFSKSPELIINYLLLALEQGWIKISK